MAAAEKWRDATEAACARHKVALFGWTGCKPRDSMRLLEKMHNNIGSALKEKARRIMADAVLDGVQTTRVASRCDISTPKVGTATQLSNPSGKWYLEENRGSVEDLFAWLDRFHNAPDQLSQDQRCNKKRSRLNAYLKQVFGHNNGIWDY